MSSADVDGDGKPELLLAQKNFLRAVVLKQEAAAQNSTNRGGWVFSVKEQINGAGSNSRLVGAAALPNGTNAVNSLFLLDAERKALTLCERDSAGRLAGGAQHAAAVHGVHQPAAGGARRHEAEQRGLPGQGRRRLDAAAGQRLGIHRSWTATKRPSRTAI